MKKIKLLLMIISLFIFLFGCSQKVVATVQITLAIH